jgi:hypothetical protein
MKTHRNKPAVGMTLDADVVAWIASEARKLRTTPSQFANSILGSAMDAATASGGMQVRETPPPYGTVPPTTRRPRPPKQEQAM